MTTKLLGRRTWSGDRDDEGHRTYKVKHLIRSDYTDGPYIVMQTPGLYIPGAQWDADSDFDPWAWCLPSIKLELHNHNEGEKHKYWTAEQNFTTRPPPFRFQRCNDFNIEDPLLEPQKVSGSFVKYTKEATHDRFGRAITNSAWEQLRGQQVEWEDNHPTITIEQNVPYLQLSLFSPMVDTVNDRVLWGMPPRTIRLTNASWERKYYGLCYAYYTRRFEFEVDAAASWDRTLLDEGTKVLRGKWNNTTGAWDLQNIAGAAPNRFNPTHFMHAEDRHGNPITVILDGLGKPWTPDVLPTPAYVDDGTLKERNVTPPTNNTAGIAVPTGVTATATDGGSLVVGRTYIWNITAKSASGETTISDSVSLTIAGSNKKASLAWSAVTDATSYRVYREHAAGKKLVAEVKAPDSRPGSIYVQKYDESNFLLLRVPIVF